MTQSNNAVVVRTGVKAGGNPSVNNAQAVTVRTGVKAGGVSLNHVQTHIA